MNTLRKDQRRAAYAYQHVEAIKEKAARDDYEVAVNDFGANVLRSGLLVAVARLQVQPGGKVLIQHLSEAEIPGIRSQEAAKRSVLEQVREMPLDDYLLATREILNLAQWFKRAVQATFVKG